MVFPFISGPVEGLLLIMSLSFVTYFNGVDWWYQVRLTCHYLHTACHAMSCHAMSNLPFRGGALTRMPVVLCVVGRKLELVGSLCALELSAYPRRVHAVPTPGRLHRGCRHRHCVDPSRHRYCSYFYW